MTATSEASQGIGDLPATMRAQRLDTATLTYEVTEVPVPRPGPGEVVIEVAFCGICHSDLSLLDGTFPAMGPEVITQGHEASGWVAALGEGVTGWEVGDRVVPAFADVESDEHVDPVVVLDLGDHRSSVRLA